MSNFFKSEQVQLNLQDIFETYQQIAAMTSQLATMNKEEKLDHISQCKTLIDKQKTFYGRLCLAAPEDAEAADMKTRINACQMLLGTQTLLSAWMLWWRHLNKRHNVKLTATK